MSSERSCVAQGASRWRYKRSLLSKGTKCPISSGNACLLGLVSLCPNFYCSASPPLLDVGESLFIPTAFFPEATIIFDHSFPFLQNTESFLGRKEEYISKYPMGKIVAQGRKDHVSAICLSYKWRMHLNCGFENKIRREWQLKLQRTVYPAAAQLREKQITGRPAVEQKVILTFLILQVCQLKQAALLSKPWQRTTKMTRQWFPSLPFAKETMNSRCCVASAVPRAPNPSVVLH